MLYTDNRRYPYPESAAEVGNGGLHTELLARAVDADLSALASAWANALVRSTMIAEQKLGDSFPFIAGSEGSVSPDTVSSRTGLGVRNTPGIVRADLPGWFKITGHIRSKATGTISAAAQHRVGLVHYRPAKTAGSLDVVGARYALAFQAGTADMYNGVTGMFRLIAGDQVWLTFFHQNAGSTVVVVGSGSFGTRLEVVRFRGL